MIGDPVFIKERHINNAKKINSKLPRGGDTKLIIVIFGPSGTGKTETCLCLQKELASRGKTSLPISLDDHYLILPSERSQWRMEKGINHVGVDEIDWEDVRRICYDFKKERDIKYKRTHKYCPEIEHGEISSKHIDYLIIEGLYGGWLKRFNYGDLFVYLEGTPQQTLDFRKMRGKENEDDDFRKQIVQKECNVICQLKRYADEVMPYEENETL